MTRLRWVLALALVPAVVPQSRSQVVIGPSYGYYSNAYFGRAIGFGYHKKRFSVRGFYGSSVAAGSFGYFGPSFFYDPYLAYFSPVVPPYAVAINRVNVIYQPPPTVIIQAPQIQIKESDETAGIDLDKFDPITRRPRKVELAKRGDGDKPVRPMPRVGPDLPRVMPPARRDDKDDVSLLDRGKKAFKDRAYGLAVQRFRQVVNDDPGEPLPRFLLAQAQAAIGKYRDAVKSIRAGMDRRKDWPNAKFAIRALYQGNDIDFLGHLKRLEDVVDNHPADADLLFLWAYQLWFDGNKAKSKPLFLKAKKTAKDPMYIDQFLKAS